MRATRDGDARRSTVRPRPERWLACEGPVVPLSGASTGSGHSAEPRGATADNDGDLAGRPRTGGLRLLPGRGGAGRAARGTGHTSRARAVDDRRPAGRHVVPVPSRAGLSGRTLRGRHRGPPPAARDRPAVTPPRRGLQRSLPRARRNADEPVDAYRYFRDELGVRHVQYIPVVERIGEPRRAGGTAVSARTVRPEQWAAFLVAVFDEWVRRDVGRQHVQIFEQALTAWTAAERRPRPPRAGCERLPLYCRCCPVLFACGGGSPGNRFVTSPTASPVSTTCARDTGSSSTTSTSRCRSWPPFSAAVATLPRS